MKLTMLLLSYALGSAVGSSPAQKTDPRVFLNTDPHYFVGWRPSLNECLHSCPDRRAIAEKDPERCDPNSVWEKCACYCLFQGAT